ncbi:MAG: response regulator [Opitutales bacterium]
MARILIVDDYAQLARILNAFLTHEAHQVTVAENGVEALKHFEETTFDLVITDLKMPEMDGLELIPRLKSARPSVRIIAITGNKGGNAHDRLLQASSAGADAVLPKPFSRQEFLEALERLTPPQKPAPPSATRSPVPVSPADAPAESEAGAPESNT